MNKIMYIQLTLQRKLATLSCLNQCQQFRLFPPILRLKNSLAYVVTTILIAVGMSLGACSGSSPDSENPISGELNVAAYAEIGDLDALKARNQLRVLIPLFSDQARYLPRQGLPIAYEKELILSYAASVGLVPIWVYEKEYGGLISRLNAGEGDMISANMTATESRKKVVDFSLPINIVKEKLVVATSANIKTIQDMAGKTLAIQASSSFWGTAQELITLHPEITIIAVDEGVSIQAIVDDVADGSYDATIVDSNLLDAILVYSDDVKSIADVADNRVIAWAVRKGAKQLKISLDNFIQKEKLAESPQGQYLDDLDLIKQRKTIRVLTRNNTANYYLWRGQLMGFEYELVKQFAKQQGVRLEMIVVPARDQLEDWLRDGRGDLIAASLTIPAATSDTVTKAGKNSINTLIDSLLDDSDGQSLPLVYSKPYNTVNEVVVTRHDDESIKTLANLLGRKIYIRKSSSYWVSLTKIIKSGVDLKLVAVPEEMETEEIISKVADGTYDITIADSHIVEIETAWRNDIKSTIIINKGIKHGWLMRQSNPQLIAAVSGFISKSHRGLFYNIAKTKYFKKKRRIAKHVSQRADRIFAAGNKSVGLSPYDQIVKTIANESQLDWRLVISQMYQESRFDPKAKSWVGAKGLMQVMPRTAEELGITQLDDPKQGIMAGMKYLKWLRNRFEPELSVKDRMWFVLAAYNAGVGHVRDARRLAKQQGLDPNQWFQNVELAMLLLAKPQYSKKARFGYVRGAEPVNYVRSIKERYQAYLQLTDS